MVVGPGPSSWIQVGWERDQRYDTQAHAWYQYIGPNMPQPIEQHWDPAYVPVDGYHTWTIEAMDDPGGDTLWTMWIDSIALDQVAAAELEWTAGGQYGVDAQWSGEVSYVESEMGGSYLNTAHIEWPMWNAGGGWSDIMSPYLFDSQHPKYAGDARQYADGTWGSETGAGIGSSCRWS